MPTTTQSLPAQVTLFGRAGDHAVSLVEHVPTDRWDDPALGTWTVRMLVGHISRSFVTVIEYLGRPAERIEVRSAAAYYLAVMDMVDPAQIRSRAENAALSLGSRPFTTILDLRDRAVALLSTADDIVIHTIAGGMRLSDYLPTRIFELAVHSLDLASAIGRPDTIPPDVAHSATELAVAIAGERGDTQSLLAALTGRGPLPEGYSVV
ncbi:maleylpyruvate isomerase N-terminal domain-containing protein [Mycobacterium sp. shizuoka-1]|uniref:maleylpyruvate isomerase N-terminal domain-containing protein n=1 Tax=Mycobacterium sp. shizuoka-1 TaxID=2039281 RepID=UPI000C063672|nr:maleylpyruvate isomerase N-terminal domain-containing protein [Mycobacterium sp. shizuoka-1]GAY14358.1 hypothetical protein MSZK_10840 [Mycobacterium sp. shizuoka-1]